MKITVGVMGSAGDAQGVSNKEALAEKANALALALAARPVLLMTGATTGIVYVVGKAAHEAGILHVGISPANDSGEHVDRFKLPLDACDLIIYTGFGLKGRNVVLVRSCDVVLFISGSIGSLNEFTIAYDEGRVIGCLTGTGGVADEVERLIATFKKETKPRGFYDDDPDKLLEVCIAATRQ